LQQTVAERTTPELHSQLQELSHRFPSEEERAAHAHALSDSIYTFRRARGDPLQKVDLRGHTETWNDMVRLQEAGLYPSAFSSISCPVLMLHGSYDPHPGKMIRDGLRPFLQHLEYQELRRCGHAPWIEEYARDEFLALVRGWLWQHAR
jgi:pimeloyl-ACP methyl ester carboxylesterase